MRAVGASISRGDATDKVQGKTAYAGDLDLPGQAWLKIVFAGVPHAQLTAVETAAAAAAPGVIAVLTAKDVPVNEYGLAMYDQPVLCGVGSTRQAERVRWEADQVAVVVAETQAQAEAAAKLVQLTYAPLPLVTDPLVAMQPGAPLLHPDEFNGYPYGVRDRSSNVLHAYRIQQGDLATGFAQADVIVEATYRTHAQEHAYLQPEAGLAQLLPDGRIEVICGGQWMHEERQQIAHALGLPEAQIVVRYPAIGGAFGGREDISIQIVLALAALKTGRPVKIIWSREESIVGHHKRHPYTIWAKWGATLAGKIVAAQMDATSDAGAYAYTSTKVLGNAILSCLGPYEIPNVLVDARTVYTNNCPSGAFRGFGGPQGHFAAEMQVNKLAAALGMDPVELRRRNLWQEGSPMATRGVVPAGCTAPQVLEEGAKWMGEERGERAVGRGEGTEDRGERREGSGQVPSLVASCARMARGRGIAICFKNVGFSLAFPEHCHAWVELQGRDNIERAVVGCVGAEVGQGTHQVMRQIAAEVLDVALEKVFLVSDNTDVVGSSGSASASRMTFMAGNAIKGAAERALQEWQNEERPARAEFLYRPRPTTGYAPGTGESDPHITIGYCAQVADVEVDLETGHVTVKRLVSVNDVGKAVNPQLVEGQIEGGVAQSVGWTLLENFIQKEGRTLTPHLSNYLIPGVADVVEEIVPVILEFPDPQGPLGIRGMAEMPFIPTAPAIGAAIYAATGVWLDQLPYTPERVWAALQQRAVV
ncbi:MAG: xanthine dehydrogenase family protein [Caldilineaceae bacterium]|nr:xanthine dehydrogenase family protein [Caldilineaceae bacterium]